MQHHRKTECWVQTFLQANHWSVLCISLNLEESPWVFCCIFGVVCTCKEVILGTLPQCIFSAAAWLRVL